MSSWVGPDIFLGSYICTNEGRGSTISPFASRRPRVGFSSGKCSPLRGKGPRLQDGRRCCGLNPSREGTALPLGRLLPHFLSRREGAEKLPAGQAGGFPAVPTPKPHPFAVCSAPRLPGPRSTHLLLTPGPETPSASRVPPSSQGSGGGRGRRAPPPGRARLRGSE